MSRPKTNTKQSAPGRTNNITFRCHALDKDAIMRAAEKAGKSDSEYCRDVIIDYAYSDLGERRPNLAPVGRSVRRTMVEQAAAARGLTVAQYTRELAEAQAAADLGYVVPAPQTVAPPQQRRQVIAPAILPRLAPVVRRAKRKS